MNLRTSKQEVSRNIITYELLESPQGATGALVVGMSTELEKLIIIVWNLRDIPKYYFCTKR